MLDFLLKSIQAILTLFLCIFIICLGIFIISYIFAPVVLLALAIMGYTKIAIIATIIYVVIGILFILLRKTGENNG